MSKTTVKEPMENSLNDNKTTDSLNALIDEVVESVIAGVVKITSERTRERLTDTVINNAVAQIIEEASNVTIDAVNTKIESHSSAKDETVVEPIKGKKSVVKNDKAKAIIEPVTEPIVVPEPDPEPEPIIEPAPQPTTVPAIEPIKEPVGAATFKNPFS